VGAELHVSNSSQIDQDRVSSAERVEVAGGVKTRQRGAWGRESVSAEVKLYCVAQPQSGREAWSNSLHDRYVIGFCQGVIWMSRLFLSRGKVDHTERLNVS